MLKAEYAQAGVPVESSRSRCCRDDTGAASVPSALQLTGLEAYLAYLNAGGSVQGRCASGRFRTGSHEEPPFTEHPVYDGIVGRQLRPIYASLGLTCTSRHERCAYNPASPWLPRRVEFRYTPP